jgi:hypothetical protein
MKFSLPIFPFLTENQFIDLVQFIRNTNIIFDIYCTSRIPPFYNDAMGINFKEETEKLDYQIQLLLENNINVSLTYNNIFISPSYDNYVKFVNNFRKYYDIGIRNITIPFTSWLRFGLKKEYPDLFVKNTILNRVSEPYQVYKLFMEGFDYINLDRFLIRDSDRLHEIKKVKQICEGRLNKKLYLSLLMNEHCDYHCPLQQEHFNYNCNNFDNQKTWFNSQMGNISTCQQTSIYKQAIIYPIRSELNYYFNFVDVIKLHGREDNHMFEESLKILQKINSNDILDEYILYKINKNWLDYIKNCKYKCYECDMCDNMERKYGG